MFYQHPLLLLDYYKTVHHEQYPKGLTKMTSYFTPRMSRLQDENFVISFGLQAFIKKYLVDEMNEHFFKMPRDYVLEEYKRILDNTLGEGTYSLQKIADLYDLGYLPLEIKAIPEGTKVPVKVPMIEVTNTHPDFVWLVNTIETLMSCSLWHTMISANVGYKYRQVVNKWYDLTVDDDVPRNRALGDFSMRGQESVESATKSSAAFCLSFLNTATVPAIRFLEYYYSSDCTKEPVAYGAISTEHSVMCSNYAVDGNEESFVKRLLTDIYPHNSFSMVSDSYDYWNLVDNILPSCRKEIMEHDGILLVRGDSGDPVEVITQTVFHLWNHFQGYINKKGYKVLNPHIKAIYGDSITPQRANQIYKILKEHGFAANNVSLGVGSFSMQCLETENGLQPFTRDTFGIAVKATYAEDQDGNPIMIFKNPKTDTGHFKKSQKGLCYVYEDQNGISYKDEYTSQTIPSEGNLLRTVFKNGNFVKEYSLQEVRTNLYGGEF